MVKSTNLNDVRANPAMFTWGEVVHIHDVGPYTIIEHLEDAGTRDGSVLERERSFHAYVDGKDTHTGYSSLDSALVGCIAHRQFESNKARWFAQACNALLEIK